MTNPLLHIEKRTRILLAVNVDWFFLSHRIPIARAMRDRGAEVLIAARDSGHGDAIRREGFRFVPIPLSRKGSNPLIELRTLIFLSRLYRQFQPDLVHHVTIKPVIYGSLAARITRREAVVNAISGLGYSFSAHGSAKILRPLVKGLYRVALRHPNSFTIFQNPDDQAEFIRASLVSRDRTVLIRGSGVDCMQFRVTPFSKGPMLVMLPARMLWDKGIGVFVEAAKIIRASDPNVRFVLVGAIDSDNPASVPKKKLLQWESEGIIEWWGSRTDMPHVLSQAHVIVLPTIHREGLPKVLLEAAASARPIVASDVPGCREIVCDHVNGLLVAPGDSAALSDAIRKLLASQDLRERFGSAGRDIVMKQFAVQIVVDQTLNIYQSLLGGKWPTQVATAQ